MEQTPSNELLGLVPLLLLSFIIAVVAYLLAKEKGRNIGKWTVLGAIPIVNMFCIWYFVGASNLRLEKKIDDLTNILQKK